MSCSAATFISYHSHLCLSTTFLIFLLFILLRFGSHRDARDILPDVPTNVNKFFHFLPKVFLEDSKTFFRLYSKFIFCFHPVSAVALYHNRSFKHRDYSRILPSRSRRMESGSAGLHLYFLCLFQLYTYIPTFFIRFSYIDITR